MLTTISEEFMGNLGVTSFLPVSGGTDCLSLLSSLCLAFPSVSLGCVSARKGARPQAFLDLLFCRATILANRHSSVHLC